MTVAEKNHVAFQKTAHTQKGSGKIYRIQKSENILWRVRVDVEKTVNSDPTNSLVARNLSPNLISLPTRVAPPSATTIQIIGLNNDCVSTFYTLTKSKETYNGGPGW